MPGRRTHSPSSTPARAAAGVVLLVALLVQACVSPETGQTALVARVTLPGPVDCLEVAASREGGEIVAGTLAVNPADDWRTVRPAALVYAGGTLGDAEVLVVVTGHLGGCNSTPISRGTARGTFQRGVVSELFVTLELAGSDVDGDGVPAPRDCAPSDPRIFPREGTEASPGECNGLDDDCDGVKDDGCPCVEGEARPCYPLGTDHPTLGVGPCLGGSQSCRAGTWGECEGAVVPATEACNGLDDDCDAVPDNGCPCVDGEERECYGAGPARVAGVGRCQKGRQRCVQGSLEPCVGDVAPGVEVCNGVDDDCDGETDEAAEIAELACPEQRGACFGARRSACSQTACTAADYERAASARGLAYVTDEGLGRCDDVDNDCDGQTDETCACRPGTVEPCHPLGSSSITARTGACRLGSRTCTPDGAWGDCTGFVAPLDERCNSIDDDCDGQTDETFAGQGEACPTALAGVCAAGRKGCVAGVVECVASVVPGAVAESCNQADDDCDGQTDEGFDTQNDPLRCGNSCAVCTATQACCAGACIPTNEDAQNCGGCGVRCETGRACCAAGCVDTTSDVRHCGGCGIVCGAGQACRSSRCVPSTELVCSDGDDDLDGLADCADADCVTGARCDATAGSCCRGTCAHETSCTNGADDDCDGLADCRDPDCTRNPAAELCNGLDDDCDGARDETYVGLGQICFDGVGLCRRQGAIVCTSTTAAGCSAKADPTAARTETCNGTDDDCNGQTDEGFQVGATCSDGLGVCRATGAIACRTDGSAGCSATANTAAQAIERCNGLDDDCDGNADEDFLLGTACTVGVGECLNTGVRVCKPDGTVGCSVDARAGTFETCDGKDNDCDGQTDEDFPLGTACTAGLAACARTGTIVCAANGSSTCSATPDLTQAVAESCNALDDDCDGLVDDGLDLGATCSVGVGECANTGSKICLANGAVGCSAQPKPVGTEVCDGKDNDCDGTVDDGFSIGATCAAGVGECRSNGVTACLPDGTAGCNATPSAPTAETCDNKDNDCDGAVDDGFNLGQSCSPGSGVCQRTGTVVCTSATTSACNVTADPSRAGREICNGLDDDCDGTVDERPDCGGPRNDVAEDVLNTWTMGRSTNGVPVPCSTAPPTANTLLSVPTNPANILIGSAAVRAVLTNPANGYFQEIYPNSRNANWDLSNTTGLAFSARGNAGLGWEPQTPRVVLCGPNGTGRMITPAVTTLGDTYAEFRVPLAGGSGWSIADSAGFDLRTVRWFEIHQDPQRGTYAGDIVMLIDNVRFY